MQRSPSPVELSRPLEETDSAITIESPGIKSESEKAIKPDVSARHLPPTTMQSLPRELKEEIMQRLHAVPVGNDEAYEFGLESEGNKAGRRLAQTCREWRRLIIPKLYDFVSLEHMRNKSLAQLQALTDDDETTGSIRVLQITPLRTPRVAVPEDYLIISKVICGCPSRLEERILCQFLERAYDAKIVIIAAGTSGAVPKQTPLYLSPSISKMFSLTSLRTFDPPTPELVSLLACAIRAASSLTEVELMGRPGTAADTAQMATTAGEHARVEVLQALASRFNLASLRLAYSYICETPTSSRLVWNSALTNLYIGLDEENGSTLSPLLRGMMPALSDGLFKLAIGRRYLMDVRAVLEQNEIHRDLRQLRVVAPNPSEPFQSCDLLELSTTGLQKLCLYGRGSAALAYAVFSTKACTSLKELKLRDTVLDKAKLRAVRDIVRERNGLIATWNKKRLEDLDLT